MPSRRVRRHGAEPPSPEARAPSHNSRFGFRHINKQNVKIFPFNFLSMSDIAEKRVS